MPSARAEEFRRAATKPGFQRTRQKGSHERWKHPDGRSTTIPIHGSQELGAPLYYRILQQLGIDEQTFHRFTVVRKNFLNTWRESIRLWIGDPARDSRGTAAHGLSHRLFDRKSSKPLAVY